MLIYLEGVYCGGINRKIERGIRSYDEALKVVKKWSSTDCVVYWEDEYRVYEFPLADEKNETNQCRWGSTESGILFMWVDSKAGFEITPADRIANLELKNAHKIYLYKQSVV